MLFCLCDGLATRCNRLAPKAPSQRTRWRSKRAGTGTCAMPARSSLDLNTGFVIYKPQAGAARTHHTHRCVDFPVVSEF